MNNILKHYQSFLRATEQAAIEAAKLRGCGDGKLADKAATEAMRSVLNEEPIHTRVVDGLTGAKFLQALKPLIENPLSMLI